MSFVYHTNQTKKLKKKQNKTSSSAIAEKRARCMVGQFWPKMEDDILQTM